MQKCQPSCFFRVCPACHRKKQRCGLGCSHRCVEFTLLVCLMHHLFVLHQPWVVSGAVYR